MNVWGIGFSEYHMNKLPRMTHITIPAISINESIRFYDEWLSMKPINDLRNRGGNTVWIGYQREGLTPQYVIVLMNCSELKPINHLGFQVDSLAELKHLEIRANNLSILENAITYSGQDIAYWMTIRDPSNNIIEFTFGQKISGLL